MEQREAQACGLYTRQKKEENSETDVLAIEGGSDKGTEWQQ